MDCANHPGVSEELGCNQDGRNGYDILVQDRVCVLQMLGYHVLLGMIQVLVEDINTVGKRILGDVIAVLSL